jgi:hypothetical protein
VSDDPTSGEPFEALLELVGAGDISLSEAKNLIANATRILLVDDRWELWAPRVPSSSILAASIRVGGRSFYIHPKGLTHLLRSVFEVGTDLSVSVDVSCELAILVGRTIESMPIQYSYASILAQRLELGGSRANAKALWSAYADLVPHEWYEAEGEWLFLELTVPDEARQATSAEVYAQNVLQGFVETGHASGDVRTEYYGLRHLGLGYFSLGDFQGASHKLEAARRVAEAGSILDQTGELVLLGDGLLAAAVAEQRELVESTVEILTRAAEEAPPLVGNAAVLARTARLLAAVGEIGQEWRVVTRIASCLR